MATAAAYPNGRTTARNDDTILPMLYFLLHDAESFDRRISPALAASWRRRTFRPIVVLAADLGPALAAFADRYRLTADERPFLADLQADRPFDRRLWRHLAGEVLL